MIDFLLIIALLGFIFCLIMLLRNDAVYNYRKDVLDYIWENYSTSDDFSRKMNLFHEVEYHDMVRKFWKPLDSFFDPSIKPPKNEARN